MAIYDAVTGVEEGRKRIPEAIAQLVAGGKPGREGVEAEAAAEDNFVVRRALKVVLYLSRMGYGHLLRQLQHEISQPALEVPLQGVVIQLSGSERWQYRYGTSPFDVVVAVPNLGRVLALSTTAVEKLPEEDNPQFMRILLQNFHFYQSFNRAHAVRGRRAGILSSIGRVDPSMVKPLMFLLRTSADAKRIAASQILDFFTPVGTYQGLRLGFYFGMVCKIRDVMPVTSKTGFGWDLAQNDVEVEDYLGRLRFRLNVGVFKQSLNLTENDRSKPILDDPLELRSYAGQVLVVGTWFLGDEKPHVTYLGLLGDSHMNYTALSYMNSRRKVSRDRFEQQFGSELLSRGVDGSVQASKDWVYFLEEGWRLPVLEAGISSGMRPLNFHQTLELGIQRTEYVKWFQASQLLFQLNPHLLKLYTTDQSDRVFEEVFGPPPRLEPWGTEPSIEENEDLVNELKTHAEVHLVHPAKSRPTPPVQAATRQPTMSQNDEVLVRQLVENLLKRLGVGAFLMRRAGNIVELITTVPADFTKKGLLAALILNEIESRLPDIPRASFRLVVT